MTVERVEELEAEVRRLRDQLERSERERLGAETATLEVIDERDAAHEWADKLAYAIAPQSAIGEHSSMNNPWANAVERAEELEAEVRRLRAQIDAMNEEAT